MKKEDPEANELLAVLRKVMPDADEEVLRMTLPLLTITDKDGVKNVENTIEALEHVKDALLSEWERDVSAWIFREVSGSPCSKISMWRLGPGLQPEEEIRSFPVQLLEGTRAEVDYLALIITSTAQEDAYGLGVDSQAYVLFAVFPEETDRAPRKVFRTAPPKLPKEKL